MRYADRTEAGRHLAEHLVTTAGELEDPLVLGLPRGGVPVAAEVARALDAQLDVLVARKIGAPAQPEFGVGALAEDGDPVFDERSLRMLGLDPDDLAGAVADERAELERRVRRYRGDRPAPAVRSRTVVLVDDGLATGVTARAALRALRRRRPARLILAVPVGSPQTVAAIRAEADLVVCPAQPEHFAAVGQWYQDFSQTPDEEVVHLLLSGARPPA